MRNIAALLAVLSLTVILGLSTVPVMAYKCPVAEEIIITDFDPSDDVHGSQCAI